MASSNEIIAGRVAVQVRGDNSQLKKDVGESESVLKNLKRKLGEDSGFGLAMKSLAGAGAVAGIGLAAQKFEQMTSAIAESANKLRSGQIGYSEYIGELVKSIPVIGNVVSGIENITEAITGQKAEAEAARARSAENRKAIDSANFSGSGYDSWSADRRATAIERKLAAKNMTPLDRIKAEASDPYNSHIGDIVEDRSKAIDSIREKNQREIDRLTEIANKPVSGKYQGEMLQKIEAQRKLEEIRAQVEKEVGEIRKASAREIAANEKARDAAVAEAEKKNADEQKAAREAGIKYAVNATKGLMGFVLGGGGRSIIDHTKDAVFRANNFAGSAMDVSGVVTGKTDGKLDSILTAVNNFATMVGQKLPIDATPRAT